MAAEELAVGAVEPVDPARDRLLFDAMSAVVLLLTAVLGAYLPKYLSSSPRGSAQAAGSGARSLAFHLGNMLSGGVMLSAGFCHLLADSLRELAFIGRFPIATFLAALGYLVTLLADQLVQVLTADPGASAPSRGRRRGGAQYARLSSDGGGWDEGPPAVELAVARPRAPGGGGAAFKAPDAGREGIALLSLGLPASDAGGAAPGDVALCTLASGSPRALTAGSVFARSGSRAGAARAVGAGGADGLQAPAAAVAGNGVASARPAGWAAADDLIVSHPATPDPLQQQQQEAAAAAATAGAGAAEALAHSRSLQVQLEWQDEWGDTADSDGAAAAASADGTPRLPCSSRLAASPRGGAGAGAGAGGLPSPLQQAAGPGRAGSLQKEQQQRQLGCRAGGPGKHQCASWHCDDSVPTCGACACCQLRRCCCNACAHSEGMTEAASMALVAGHLELEIVGGEGPGKSGEAAGACGGAAAGAHNHAHFQVLLSHQPLSFATTVLLACALCIHSVLEGMALGAQQSMQATQDIMLAIAAHKGLAAYALGASIVESKASSAKFWTVVAMFASATPLGIGVGFAFSNLGHGDVSAAMSALASGTFLYVALNEVIPKELEAQDGHRVAKVAALLLGFGLMSLLAVWA